MSHTVQSAFLAIATLLVCKYFDISSCLCTVHCRHVCWRSTPSLSQAQTVKVTLRWHLSLTCPTQWLAQHYKMVRRFCCWPFDICHRPRCSTSSSLAHVIINSSCISKCVHAIGRDRVTWRTLTRNIALTKHYCLQVHVSQYCPHYLFMLVWFF